MGTTPTYSWPYPDPTDPVASGAQDFEDLAEAIETTVSGLALGQILQVVSTTKTDVFSSTSGSFTAITGLSASITPSSTSSKVLVIVNIKGASLEGTSSATFNYRLMRGATPIGVGDAAGSRDQATGSLGTRSIGTGLILMADTAVVLDSPATTSATTYSVEGRSNTTSAWYVNRTEDDTDSSFFPRAVSTVTLLEVAP